MSTASSVLVFLETSNLEELKNTLEWGTYGKGGAEHCAGTCPEHQLRWKKLIDCETEHLQAILRNQRQVHATYYADVIRSILADRGVTPEDFSFVAEQELYTKAAEGFRRQVKGDQTMDFKVPDLNAPDGGATSMASSAINDAADAGVGAVDPNYIPDSIDIDLTGFIFVFGANREGAHGGGAARVARQRYGAIWGQGHGFQGQAYGIVTCGKPVGQPGYEIDFSELHAEVQLFLDDAVANPDKNFQVTRVGCGLAATANRGDKEIAPLFLGAPDNCYFDKQWAPYLEPTAKFWGHKG